MKNLWPALLFIGGIIFGSFLNVVIYRLPRRMSLVRPRSACPACHTPIPFYQNIPLLSFLLLRGQCAYCEQKISLRYPFIEFISGLLTLIIGLHFGPQPQTLFYLLLLYFLIAIGGIDFERQIIPNQLLLPLLLTGVALNFWTRSIAWMDGALGFAVGGGAMYLLAMLGNWYFKKESVGMGDVKMAAVLGFFLGWKLVLLTLYSGYLFAALYYVGLRLTRHSDKISYLPMAPFFAIGAIMWAGWWQPILNFYLSIVT